jgi:hypothetical protein
MFPQTVPTHVTWSSQKHVLGLKGQCHKIFCLGFFRESSSPKPLKIILGPFQIFSKILGDIRKSSCTTGSTIPVANCQRCQRHRWQIIGIVSDCLHLQVNLKENNFLYVNSTTQRCPNKIIKTFLIVDFFHLPLSTTTVVHLELQISPRILKKNQNACYGILRGKLIHEKNLKSKISWPYPLNVP